MTFGQTAGVGEPQIRLKHEEYNKYILINHDRPFTTRQW